MPPGARVRFVSGIAEIADSFFKPAVNDLVPYEPGKPVEEVQRELGLERVVKLASNEGPFGPFPAGARGDRALRGRAEPLPGRRRLPRCARRSPSGTACASRRSSVGAGVGRARRLPQRRRRSTRATRSSAAGRRSRATSIDARKLGAVPRTRAAPRRRATTSTGCSARSGRARRSSTSAMPNNPTGTTNGRAELDAFFERAAGARPRPSSTRPTSSTSTTRTTRTAIEDYLKHGRRVVVLRTFSKIYGLAGLRVGYGVAPADVVTAIGKVRRAFDVTTPAQAAALASLDDAGRARAAARGERRGPRPARGDPARPRPRAGRACASANFLFADVGSDARALFERLLREGVIVRPLARLRRAGRRSASRSAPRRSTSSLRGPRPRGRRDSPSGWTGRKPLVRGHRVVLTVGCR